MRTIDNLVALYEDSCSRFADRPLFGEKRDAEWKWTTYGEFQRAVDELRGGLASLGIRVGDRVGIVSRNRVEWAVAAYACYGLGATFVPMYEAQQPSEIEFILADSGAKLVFASGDRLAGLVRGIADRMPDVAHVIALDAPPSDPHSYAALLAAGRAAPVPPVHPDPDQLCGFVYTSGTTGRPKGVMLSHRNIASNVAAASELFPIGPDDRSLSFLPWAHVFGQSCELDLMMSLGGSTAINTEVAHLLDELQEVKPTVLVAVPRIFHRMHESVQAQIAGKPSVIRALFRAGIRAANDRRKHEGLGPIESLELRLADRLIFSKIRQKFGGRLRFVISGSAALSPEVAEFVDALGLPVYEGYGLSETSPVITANRPGARKIGSVGQVLPGVTIRIDESAAPEPGQGEIIAYGAGIMKGYHNRPEETAATLDADGGLRTGDLGYLDADGYLYITGRIKDYYKLANGKFVSPAPIEQQIALSPYIVSAMLHGVNRPYNVALVVLDIEHVRAWAQKEGIDLGADPAEHPKVRELIARELERETASFKSYERPRGFALVVEDFSTENDMLTPTLKLKRRNVMAKYGALLESLYKVEPTERTMAAVSTAPPPA